MTAIETSALRKVYHPNRKNQLVGLDSLDLQVKEGDIFGFIGPNGAGKSTTIKILVGLAWPTAGSARIFGQAAGSVEARKKVGYLPEVANYHEFMGVGELLGMHAQLAGIPSHSRAKACSDALDQVGLLDRRGSRMKELSKGMKQRFGIAQALVASPPLLILDEVTSGLDPLAQKEVKDVILALKRRGITIFFSSHQLTEVEHICDIIGIIHRGRLLQVSGLDAFLQVDDTVVVQYRGDTAVSDKLVAAGKVVEGATNGGSLTLPRDQVDALLDQIHQSGGHVYSVQPHRLTLENAFFNLIQGQTPPMMPIIRISVLESIRRQVHLITLFLGVLLLVIPSLVSAFSMGAPERVVKDMGLTLIGYYSFALMLFLSVSAVPGEIERKTIYPLLARPMSRLSYLVAKFLSVSVVVAASLALLGTCLLAAEATFLRGADLRSYLVVGEYLLEDMVLGAACVCFSTFASPVLAAVMGVFIYIVGGLSPAFISFFLDSPDAAVTAHIAKFFKAMLPHFEFFQIKDAVAHGDPIVASFLWATVGYAVAWIVLWMLLAGISFERKDL